MILVLHRVLIVSYLFPPSGGIGVPRYAAYSRYLRDHGCEVSVIAPRNPNTPLYDPQLLEKVPPETDIHRVFSPSIPYGIRDLVWKRFLGAKGSPEREVKTAARGGMKGALREAISNLFTPDIQKFWVPFVRRMARRLIREQGVGTVILNTPPFSLHALIPPLKREFPRLKWITEVRDDWLGYYLQHFDSAYSDAKHRLAVKMEGAGMRASDYVVAVTPAQRDDIRNRYPDQPAGKFLCIPNGYDADLYQDFQPSREGRDNMVVAYYGTLYATGPYDISGYLEAVEALPESLRDRIETRFIGRIAYEAEALLTGRKARIVKLGFFPQAEGVRQLQQADYLLLAANDPTQHAGKLFDYIATGLPTLALSPADGEVARLLRETGGGIAVDGHSPEAIRQALIDGFERLRGGSNRFPAPNWPAIQSFERRALVAQLVKMTGIGQNGRGQM